MRVLVEGMQSSGASLVAFFLAQMEGTVAVVDLFYHQLAPELTDLKGADHVVVKTVFTKEFDHEDHRRSFAPDRTVLVLRHPYHNYVALSRKNYRDYGGSVEDKLLLAERAFRNQSAFSAVVLYEEFVQQPLQIVDRLAAIGLPVDEHLLDFPRNREEVLAFNRSRSEWCDSTYRKAWSFGNVRDDHIRADLAIKYVPRKVRRRVKELCPSLLDYFEDYYRRNGIKLRNDASVIWHDAIVRGSAHTARRLGRRVRRAIRSSLSRGA